MAKSRKSRFSKPCASTESIATKRTRRTAKETVMSEQEIKVPDLGGADEVEVIELLVSAGDSVEVEDPILTVETDKASVELPSPGAGKIIKLTVKVGDKVKEGDVVGIMESSGESGGEAGGSDDSAEDSGDEPNEKAEEKPKSDTSSESQAEPEQSKPAPKKKSGGSRTEIVLVPPLDGMENVPVIEINVSEGDTVEADDALVTVESDKASMEIPSPFSGKVAKILVVEGDKLSEGDKLLELTVAEDGGEEDDNQQDDAPAADSGQDEKPEPKTDDKAQQKEPAPQSQSSTYEPPAPGAKIHAGPAVRKLARELGADMTRIKGSGPKSRILKKGVKMTPLPFLLKACATALAELPQFNVSLDMERKEVVRKQYIHIGIAVDTPNGLMVPVIRDVDKKGLWELAAESAELAQKARDKKLKPAEMQGACFTITSLGGIGGTAFTPIVNAPEVAILGVSKAAMKPVWDGSEFQPRLLLPLSLSYDHRAVNGADAARFTTVLSQLLGDIGALLL